MVVPGIRFVNLPWNQRVLDSLGGLGALGG